MTPQKNTRLPKATARGQALKWLSQVVIDGRSVNEVLALPHFLQPSSEKSQDLAFAKQLLFGSLRYFQRLSTIKDSLLEKPFKAKDQDIGLIIILGLYQITCLATPDHAAISESVELTRQINKSWSSGLVNGVLRRFLRERSAIEEELSKSIQFQFSHPGWMVKRLQQDWPDEYQQILKQNNQQAPMCLRVNTRKNTVSDYRQRLAEAGIEADCHGLAVDALLLKTAVDVAALPGFDEGLVTVQDGAAQLAIELLDLSADMKVLDACAAPGGKTTHLLQREPHIKLVAVEMSANRALKIEQTLKRMNLVCDLVIADVTDLDSWWDGEQFDRILLDVPCSASGVIRRNPDIKIHRKATDLQALLETQKKILACAWQLLKPGGKLVYATCSSFKAENEQQIHHFCAEHQAKVLKLDDTMDSRLSCRASLGYQILPGEREMDGFYFCGLQKPAG